MIIDFEVIYMKVANGSQDKSGKIVVAHNLKEEGSNGFIGTLELTSNGDIRMQGKSIYIHFFA